MLRLRSARVLRGRDHQVADIDDSFQLAHPVKEVQGRVVRPVQFHVEGNFAVVLLRLHVFRCVAPQFHPCMARFRAHHGHEPFDLLLVGHNALLDLELLLQFGELLLDLLQLRTIRFEFVVLPNLVFQGMLRRSVLLYLAFEHGKVQRHRHHRTPENHHSPLLDSRHFAKVRHRSAFTTSPSRRSG